MPLIFMVGWRMGCHTLMLSSRYSSILLYPALIAVAWLCVSIPDAVKHVCRHFPQWNRVRA